MLVLNIVAGKMDRPGGYMFTKPAVDAPVIAAKIGQKGHWGLRFSRVRHLPEFADEFPVATMAEEMLAEGEGQIKAMITIAGNPVLSTPNGRQLERGLANLKYMAAVDFYVNETTRHADVILPPVTALETDQYDLTFLMFGVRNTAKYALPLFEPPRDAKHEWEILLELQSRLEARGFKDAVVAWLTKQALDRLQPQKLLGLLLRFGPYGPKFNPFGGGLTLNKLKKAGHGIDLGALTPCFPDRLFTKTKRIQLAPEILVGDLERVKKKFFDDSDERKDDYDMLLIGRRQLRSNNSWMHNSMRLVKGKNRCTALMHPSDAAKRRLSSGQTIRVHSRVGTIEIMLEVSKEIMPGVISIPHGWGHHRPGIKLETAQNHAGVSINDITDHSYIDALCGTAAVNGVPVRVEAVRA
jgi:anaerobic selenocysteine-containing dehydrogenase